MNLNTIKYKGLEIRESVGHGKAVKGTKATATMQVIRRAEHDAGGYMMVHQVRFKVDCPPCKEQAIEKAKNWVDKLMETKEEFERCRDDRDYFIANYVKKQTTAGQMENVGDKVEKLLKQMYERLPYWMQWIVKPTKSLDA